MVSTSISEGEQSANTEKIIFQQYNYNITGAYAFLDFHGRPAKIVTRKT